MRRTTMIGCLAAAIVFLSTIPAFALGQAVQVKTAIMRLSHLQGQVVDSAGRPIRAAIVETDDPPRATVSDDDGYFKLHDLPAGPITISVRHAGFDGTEFQLRLPPDSTVGIGVKLLRAALAVEVAPAIAAAETDPSLKTNRLRVVSADYQPVVHANVTIEGAVPRITDEKGEVSLGSGTRQTFTVNVRRIGYAPWFGNVDFADTTLVFTIKVQPLGQTLATVNVNERTIKTPLELTGFYDRWMMRQKGTLSAVFIGPEELEFRHPDKITNMLYGLNGVRVIRNKKTGDLFAYSTQIVSMGAGLCPMAIVIDGQQLVGTAIDKILDANDVAAIEIYSRGGNMPTSLHANDSACGVLVFWTGSRKP
jgi:hypothetical protein